MTYKKELKQALRLADIADKIGLKYFLSKDIGIDSKADNSPVTRADTEIEAALSKIVTEEFGDSYIGEEGARHANNDRRWLIDPLDGTRNFVRGFPVWGSLISLKDGDEVVVASVSAPALGRRWWASKGNGAWTCDPNGRIRRIKVSKVKQISESFLLNGSFNSYEHVGLPAEKVFNLMRSADRNRAPGDFFGYMLVAEGAVDGFVEVPSALWDLEASAFIVEQAGGSIWTTPKDLTTIKLQRLSVASNSLLEDKILSQLELR